MPIAFCVHAQLVARARKRKLYLPDKSNPVALTERVSKVARIPLSEEVEEEAIEKTLG